MFIVKNTWKIKQSKKDHQALRRMTRYLVFVMFVSMQLTMDRHVQGEPSPDPKGEKIGRYKFLKHIDKVLGDLKRGI